MKRNATVFALLVLSAATLAGCSKPPPKLAPVDGGPPQDHQLLIQGVVTNAANQQVVSGVTVTIYGEVDGWGTTQPQVQQSDAGGYYTVTQTDAHGFFSFPVSADVHNLLVQYQLQGYQTLTKTINPAEAAPPAACPTFDAGVPCEVPSNLLVIDASAALTPVIIIDHVAGWVYAGPAVANGATVELVSPDAPMTPLYTTTTDMNGHFDFANEVMAGTYDLLVLPFDSNAGAPDMDHVANFQLYTLHLGAIPQAGENVSNLVIILQDTKHDIEGGTLINLSTPYPISIDDLMSNTITGVEPPLKQFSLQFGAEVDPRYTSFEFVQYDQVSRHSAPIPAAVTWTDNVIATITPAPQMTDGGLVGSLVGYTTYELRIHLLTFMDGTIAIPNDPSHYGSIDFTINELPPVPPNPTPTWYVQNNPKTPNATQAVVDSKNIWLLDKNGDYIFDTDPTKNWGPDNHPQIQWTHQAGAVAYRVWARMGPPTLPMGMAPPGPLSTWQEWQEIEEVPGTTIPDTSNNLNPLITATINPYQMKAVEDMSSPWLFGWNMQIAVTSENEAGYDTPIDPTGTLVLPATDKFLGLVTGAQFDPNVGPYATTLERGNYFYKSVRVDFSEPMNTTITPNVTLLSNLVSLVNLPMTTSPISSVAWGDQQAPSPTPLNAASSVYLTVAMRNHSPCSELLTTRYTGDKVFPVRDATPFMVDPSAILVFVNPDTGDVYTEMENVGVVKPGQPGSITTMNGLSIDPATNIPAGTLVCALDNANLSANPTASLTGSNLIRLTTSVPFVLGQQVMIYESGTRRDGLALKQILTVKGYDSTDGNLFTDGNINPGFDATMDTVAFPITLGGEAQLRPQFDVTPFVQGDVQGAGPGTIINLSAPVPVAQGDTLLVDLDGNLATTTDQFLTPVANVGCDLSATPNVNYLEVNLPPTAFLFEKTSRVIGLGDGLLIDNVHDTTPLPAMMPGMPAPVYHLETHRNRVTVDGAVYGGALPKPPG